MKMPEKNEFLENSMIALGEIFDTMAKLLPVRLKDLEKTILLLSSLTCLMVLPGKVR